jgi:hypothetical protein
VSSIIRGFGATRMAVGAHAWVSPATAARIFGLALNSDPVLAQLFGVREFALGALTATSCGTELVKVLRIGIALDAIDAIGCVRRRDQLLLRGKVLTAGGAVLLAVIGAGALATITAEE